MNEKPERRGTDVLLIEMHGMLQRMDQRGADAEKSFAAHVEADKAEFKKLGERLDPLEKINNFFQVAWKIGVGIIAVGGIGGVVTWLKVAANHVVRP